MGSCVASIPWAVVEVADLAERCAEQEMEAEDEDWVQTSHLASTVAMLRTWAAESSFPLGWPHADVAAFHRSLAGWDERLKRCVMPLALGWLRDTLDPLAASHAECPALSGAHSLIDALLAV